MLRVDVCFRKPCERCWSTPPVTLCRSGRDYSSCCGPWWRPSWSSVQTLTGTRLFLIHSGEMSSLMVICPEVNNQKICWTSNHISGSGLKLTSYRHLVVRRCNKQMNNTFKSFQYEIKMYTICSTTPSWSYYK